MLNWISQIFAAGLLAYGVHEIYEFLESQNSQLLQLFIWTEIWNINETIIGDLLMFLTGWSYDPTYPLRFEKSFIGSLLVGLFGWNDNPAILEVVLYVSYYIFIIFAIKRISQEQKAIKKN